MRVIRAEKLGFCRGVEKAIELALETAANSDRVYSLGHLIHNNQVVEKLTESGLIPVESLDEVHDGTVVIRAHGVGPDTMAAARQGSVKVVDATCVLVRRAQQVVEKLHAEGYHVVVIGDAEHAEVRGIVSYAPNVTVIAGVDELDSLPANARLGVLAQTTLAQSHFAMMVGQLAARPFRELRVINTLCLEVVRRQEAAIGLSARVDVVFVVGALHSANTRELARICRERGTKTYHLESWESFRPEYVAGCATAGVTAGASTPDWIIEQFVSRLEDLEQSPRSGRTAAHHV